MRLRLYTRLGRLASYNKRGGAAKMAETTAALSELAESFAGDEERRIKREDFEAVLRRHLSGSHAEQQIAQLWDKVGRPHTYIPSRPRWNRRLQSACASLIPTTRSLPYRAPAAMQGRGRRHRPGGHLLLLLAADATERVPGQSPHHSPPPTPPCLLQLPALQGTVSRYRVYHWWRH